MHAARMLPLCRLNEQFCEVVIRCHVVLHSPQFPILFTVDLKVGWHVKHVTRVQISTVTQNVCHVVPCGVAAARPARQGQAGGVQAGVHAGKGQHPLPPGAVHAGPLRRPGALSSHTTHSHMPISFVPQAGTMSTVLQQ